MSTVYEARVEAELPAAGRLHQVGAAWSIQLLILPESSKYHRSIEYQLSSNIRLKFFLFMKVIFSPKGIGGISYLALSDFSAENAAVSSQVDSLADLADHPFGVPLVLSQGHFRLAGCQLHHVQRGDF